MYTKFKVKKPHRELPCSSLSREEDMEDIEDEVEEDS